MESQWEYLGKEQVFGAFSSRGSPVVLRLAGMFVVGSITVRGWGGGHDSGNIYFLQGFSQHFCCRVSASRARSGQAEVSV